jgi:hypothetical protein
MPGGVDGRQSLGEAANELGTVPRLRSLPVSEVSRCLCQTALSKLRNLS